MGHAPRILFVDDNEALRRSGCLLLSGLGYVVDDAEDGEAGWRAVSSAHYDLVITDHDMPRLSGLALVERMEAAGIVVPVIMVSGTPLETVLGSASRAEPLLSAFLPKPFGPVKLRETVEQVLAQTIV